MISSVRVQELVDLDLAGFGPLGDFPDLTTAEAAAWSIKCSVTKKWLHPNTSSTDSKALEKFLSVNDRCAVWSLPCLDSKAEMLLNGFKQAIWDFWNVNGFPLVDSMDQVLDRSRLGPGVNRGSAGTTFYQKMFSAPLTSSDPNLYFWYKRYIRKIPEWSNAELTRIETHGSLRIVGTSKLSFVPKNDLISRCICIEPSLNTFYQLGFADYLNARLLNRFGIDLKNQQKVNRRLARLGSKTDSLSTIDLSSASDSISLEMLKWALPSDFISWLVRFRTPAVEIPDGSVRKLHMVSSMGNGYTFPLQTVLFSCMVVASMNFRGLKTFKRNGKPNHWAVFGDDIICPSEVTQDVLQLLELLGFKVNDDKTFVKGPFRESCGSDYFLGQNIRGVFIRRLNDPQDFYVAINRLILFQTRTGVRLPGLTNALLSHLRKPLFVPPWANVDSGIRVPLSFVRDKLRKSGPYWSYKSLIFVPTKISLERVVPAQLRRYRLSLNPSGMYVSFLQRSIVGGNLPVRGSGRYRTKRHLTSMWDDLGPRQTDSDISVNEWGRYKRALDLYGLV